LFPAVSRSARWRDAWKMQMIGMNDVGLRQLLKLLTLGSLVVSAGCAGRRADTIAMSADDDALRDELVRILDLQAEAWNRGDLDSFMEPYWKSDKLTFSSGGKTRNGWAATRDRYTQRYPAPEKMGRLRFDVDRIHRLGDTAALVLGRYHLTIGDQTPRGNFSLVFERIGGRWRITHDHTSELPEDEG
jgi:uncharacterized protein (TIGR02246 family)